MALLVWCSPWLAHLSRLPLVLLSGVIPAPRQLVMGVRVGWVQIGTPFIAEIGGSSKGDLGAWGPLGRFSAQGWLDWNLCPVMGYLRRSGAGPQGLRAPWNATFPRAPSPGTTAWGGAQGRRAALKSEAVPGRDERRAWLEEPRMGSNQGDWWLWQAEETETRRGGVLLSLKEAHTEGTEEGDRARAGQLKAGQTGRREERSLGSGCAQVAVDSHPRMAGPGACTEVVSV